MLNIEKNVKEIRLYKNALISNEHHERIYLTKKYNKYILSP